MTYEEIARFEVEAPDALDDIIESVLSNDKTRIAHYIASETEDLNHMAEIAFAALSMLADIFDSKNIDATI